MSVYIAYGILKSQNSRTIYLIPLIHLFFASLLFGQEKTQEEAYYAWFDALIGIENTALYNGLGIIEKYRVINQHHKFFKTTDFLPGSISYDGQYYSAVRMKYDLYEDQVLMNLQNGAGIVLMQPIKHKIHRFTIDNSNFIHLNDSVAIAANLNGFFELLLENSSFKLLKKHKKQIFQRRGKNALYYEFKSRNTLFIHYAGEYYPLTSRRDLMKIFPELKKEISTYPKKAFRINEAHSNLITFLTRLHHVLSAQIADP